MPKYKLTLNEEQAKATVKALEAYTRLQMGQINIVMETFPNLTWENRQSIHYYARNLITPGEDPGRSLGITNKDLSMDAKLCYEIMGTLNFALHSSSKHAPLSVSGMEMPSIEVE
jgi:hypothetical protein